MLTHFWSKFVDKDALIKLAGEQAICQKEQAELQAQFHRDQMSLLTLSNTSGNAGNPDWLTSGHELLQRIHSGKATIDALSVRIAELKKLTGM